MRINKTRKEQNHIYGKDRDMKVIEAKDDKLIRNEHKQDRTNFLRNGLDVNSIDYLLRFGG